VNYGGGIQGVARALAGQLEMRQALEFGIDDLDQLFKRRRIAMFDGLQQDLDFTVVLGVGVRQEGVRQLKGQHTFAW
jgi:hypothetical protein